MGINLRTFVTSGFSEAGGASLLYKINNNLTESTILNICLINTSSYLNISSYIFCSSSKGLIYVSKRNLLDSPLSSGEGHHIYNDKIYLSYEGISEIRAQTIVGGTAINNIAACLITFIEKTK